MQTHLLTDDCISVTSDFATTLPGIYSLLMAGEIDGLRALRPHQKQAIHCFLAQTGAMALLAAGETRAPTEPKTWTEALRGLTPGFEADEPWHLVVEDLSKPAFMQPPVPEGSWAPLKEREDTPDALDLLVTSKNHDLKAGRLTLATPEHWLFALITLQTCEGFFGRGNYGISRMNGGFASRPFVGAAPINGGWGSHLRRDIEALVARREEFVSDIHARAGGQRLLWLAPWDGRESLLPAALDPYYVEICRRIRLRYTDHRIVAMRGSSQGMRVKQPKIKHDGKEHTMPTGDPWTPVAVKGMKPLTVDGTGFTYKRIVNLLDAGEFSFAPLQQVDERDGREGVQLVFIALVRGQGETQGYHERRILVPRRAVPSFMREGSTPRLATLTRQRVQDVADATRKALQPALFQLFQSAPATIDFRDPKAIGKARPHLKTFDRAVDALFFGPHLFCELIAEPDTEAARKNRRDWINLLKAEALSVLATAETGSPLSHVRRYRARAAAERVLVGAFHHHFKDIFSEAA